MAKEASSDVDGDARVEKRKKKSKSRKNLGHGGGTHRPSYCPNKSKSFNASRSLHQNFRVSTTALKKNNDELAKSLNKCKGIIAHLQTEKLDLERQLMEMRAERPLVDEHAIESEVNKRVAAVLFPVKNNLNNAIDNMVVLSGNLTQSLQSVSAPLRMSTQSQQSLGSRGSSIGHSRGSSIGAGANFRMRPIINFPTRDGSSGSGNSSTSSNSPPKQLSKVSPMVAGHAITRPRIQLTRMDAEAMSAARERDMLEQQEQERNEEGGDINDEEIVAQVYNEGEVAQVYNEGEVYEDVEATPPHPGRSRFNLTNIGEENSFLEESRVEDSIVEETGDDVEESTRMDVLEETREEVTLSPDQSITRRSRSSVRQSSSLRQSLSVRQSSGLTRESSSRSSGTVPTVSDISGSTEVLPGQALPSLRLSMGAGPSEEVGGLTSASPSSRLSRSPLRQISSASPSPQVDILKTRRHPAVVIPDLVEMNHPALPTRHSQPCSTPFLPTPSPAANKRTSAPIFSVEEFPENPSESFLEQMIDSDPMEGPSWLFNPSNNKRRRSSVARKLSSVLSESERGSSVRMTSGLDSSDIDVSSAAEGNTSSREVSGYVLDRDLLETAVVINSPDVTMTPGPGDVSGPVVRNGNTSSETITSSVTAGGNSCGEEDMDLTRPAGFSASNNSSEKSLNSSNQENAPEQLVGEGNINESNLSISVTNNPRTPLSSLTYTDPSGEVVRFNPRTDTGVTVAGLREARILLDNVGMDEASSGVSTTPYRLSDCYIDLSPGRSMSLDQLFSLGLRAGIASPVGPPTPKAKKRKYVSEAGAYRTPPKKKCRASALPDTRQKGVRASLDMIPPCNTVISRVEVTNEMTLHAVHPNKKSEVAIRSDHSEELDTVMEIAADRNKSRSIEVNKKKSIMPSFVRLEKSPVKSVSTIGKKIHYSSIDEIQCVGNKNNGGKREDSDGVKSIVNIEESPERTARVETEVDVDAAVSNESVENTMKKNDEVEVVNVQEVPERASRRKTKVVDYAAILKEYDDDPTKKKRSKAAGKGLENRNTEKIDDMKNVSKETTCLEPRGEQSGEFSKKVEEQKSPRESYNEKENCVNAQPVDLDECSGDDIAQPVDLAECHEDEPEIVTENVEQSDTAKSPKKVGETSLVPPLSLEGASTSRGSLKGQAPSSSSSVQSGEDINVSEGRVGRSRRGQAVSYKEPPLGKKLRQGDAGSTSVYKDFKPEPKSKKKKK